MAPVHPAIKHHMWLPATLGGKVASWPRANIRQMGAFWKALVKPDSNPFGENVKMKKIIFTFTNACVETY